MATATKSEFQTYGAWLRAQQCLAVWDRDAAEEKSHWLVVPHVYCPNVAEIYQESNWHALLKLLEQADPSGEQYEMQQWSHWATQYCQIIVAPDSAAHIAASDALHRLEQYPLLDETDVAERESEMAYENVYDAVRSLTFERNGQEVSSADVAATLYNWFSEHGNWAFLESPDTRSVRDNERDQGLEALGWVYCDDDVTWRPEAETEETA